MATRLPLQQIQSGKFQIGELHHLPGLKQRLWRKVPKMKWTPVRWSEFRSAKHVAEHPWDKMYSNRFSVSAKIFSALNFQKKVLPKIVFPKNKPGEKTLKFPNKVTRKNVTPIVKVKTLQEKMKMFFNSNGTLTSIYIFYERHL